MESEYIKRVEKLAFSNPSSNRVLEYINQSPTRGVLDHASIRAVLIDPENQASHSNRLRNFQGTRDALEQLGYAIATSSTRKTVIIQDLQPTAMVYLGALLNINPVYFEYYLNRDASFESFDPAVLVFDYPENLLYSGAALTVGEKNLFKPSKFHLRGTLVKIWMNLYSYSQRVVSVKVSRSSPYPDIQILLVDSLPEVGPLTYHLEELPSKMWGTLRSSSTSLDALAHLQSLVTRQDLNTSNTEPASNTVVDFVSSKWQTLLYYAQVKISESRAPLTGDIDLIVEVIQRKHDFEKMQRTMMANLGSARLLPGLQPDSKRLGDLHTYQTIIAGWASQLERVASSLQGLLAISESLKASQQATRTQNLTILAFVFIPVSTVSSIYGMNTVEIAQQNPHMWQFGVSAAVTTLVAIFAAWSYQYWMAIPILLLSSMHRSSTKEKATLV